MMSIAGEVLVLPHSPSFTLSNDNSTNMDIRIESLKKAMTVIPDDLIPVSVAGSGLHGSVFFCLPSTTATTATKNDLRLLRSKIVAVKVPLVGSITAKRNAAAEVESLHVCSSAPTSVRASMAEIFDHGKGSDGLISWISMRAIRSGLSLRSLRSSLQQYGLICPETLLFHLFLQIGGALRWMHNVGKLVHMDVHDLNIMIDLESQSVPGYPDFVLVDFGLSKDLSNISEIDKDDLGVLVGQLPLFHARTAGSARRSHDERAFYKLLWQLAELNRPCAIPNAAHHLFKSCSAHPHGWIKFCNLLCGIMSGVAWELDDVWARCAEDAEKARDQRPATDKIWELLDKVVEDKGQAIKNSHLEDALSRRCLGMSNNTR